MTTTRTETRHCKTCGAAFTARVVTGVVNCPDCRAARNSSGGSARAKFEAFADAQGRMGEARRRGREAQAAGDAEAFERAVADFRHWAERSREVGA